MSIDPEPSSSSVRARLPKFLSFSIFALIALTVLTIAALFIDSIDNKGSRIFLTFVVFAIFVGLTALDTLKSTEREWYPPTALLSNGIFLGASLLTIWLTPSSYYGYFALAIFLVISFALILRAGVFLGFLSMDAVDKEHAGGRALEPIERSSSVAATWLGNGAAVLFTAYIAATTILSRRETAYDLTTFWDIYLKVSTAVLILAGLALSVSLLLRWFFGANERRLRREEIQAKIAAQQAAQPQSAVPQSAPDLLPWPTFADGQPFPANEFGQPDFEAAHRIQFTSTAVPSAEERNIPESPVR